MIELKDSASRLGTNPSASFQLVDDKYGGFMSAVENGQTRLALEYATHLIREMSGEIFDLRRDVDELKKHPEVEPKPAPSKRVAKKKSTIKATDAKKKMPDPIVESPEQGDED
jgi:hypothetical protein